MKDTLVVPRSADYIDKHMSSPFRQIAYSPESSHGLLLDDERKRVGDAFGIFTYTRSIRAWEQAGGRFLHIN